MTSDDVHGIHQAYSALSRHRSHAGRVSASIAPDQIAAIVSENVDVAWGHDWGWLLGWLAAADGIDSEQWRNRFADALDVDLLVERVAAEVADRIPGAVDFIHSLTQLAPAASAGCVRAISPEVVRLIESDLPAAARALVDWCFGEFIFAASVLKRGDENDVVEETDEDAVDEHPWHAVAVAIDDLVKAADWTSAGRSIAATKADLDDLRELDLLGHSLGRLAPDLWFEAMSAIDLDHLDQISQGEWTPTDRVARLVYTMASGSDPSPGRSWARRHADALDHAPSFLAAADPQLAVDLKHSGRAIVLADAGRGHLAAEAISAIAEVDRNVAADVVRENEGQILAAIRSEGSQLSDGIEDLVRAVDSVDPDWLNDRLVVVGLETLRAGGWKSRMAEARE